MQTSRHWRHDLDLIEAARTGDEQALVSLLKSAQPDIQKYARLNCRTANDIDDAVQETLWLLYRKVGTLRALTSISGWLVAVVRRECRRLAESMFHRGETDITVIENNLDFSNRPQPELRIDLAAAIRSLPEHYREVVLLRDIEEMTIEEISKILDLSRETVKARLHRARVLIREYLKG